MKKIQKIRGAHEINPSEAKNWSETTKKIISFFESYSYEEIRLPIIENTDLFLRSVGEETDIVNKEMFSFESKSGKSLSLRPEGTASCLRAAIEMGLTDLGPQRLYYHGPMYRYERPQKGRNREFYQLSIEAYGFKKFNIELEMIDLSYKLFSHLNLFEPILEINSLGSEASQKKFSDALKEYLLPLKDQLDLDSQRRLSSNTLRILDSKNPETQKLLKKGPKLSQFIETHSLEKLEELKDKISKKNIPFIINENLVRGLDYYNDVVYEWKSNQLGSQNTFCAGGRYDSLSKKLGGRDISAAGFSIGLDRLMLAIPDDSFKNSRKKIMIIILENSFYSFGANLADKLRSQFQELSVRYDGLESNLKAQLKKLIKESYDFVIILGKEEIKNKLLSFKDLTKSENQVSLSEQEIFKILETNLKDE